MAELGKNIIVKADDKVICGTKANSIQCECETIEIASADDGAWVHRIAGRKSWSVSVDFLLVPASTGNMAVNVRNLLSVGSTYTLVIKSSLDNGVTGSAILKSMYVSGAVGSLVTGTWKFEGNGSLL